MKLGTRARQPRKQPISPRWLFMEALTDNRPAAAPADSELRDPGVRDSALADLEGRVQSLEMAVTRLEDTQALEERVVARVTERLPQVKVAERDAAALDVGVMEERIVARLAERLPPAPEIPIAEPAPRQDDGGLLTRWGGGWASWLFVDMFREAKLLVQMIFDRRYQMAWTTRVVALILFPAILLAHWWMPFFLFWFPLMWLEVTREFCINLLNLVLAFALLKALSRETRRYQERLRH